MGVVRCEPARAQPFEVSLVNATAELMRLFLTHRHAFVDCAKPNCPTCDGGGKVDTLDGGGSVVKCPSCNGTGWELPSCTRCQGRGQLLINHETGSLIIPAQLCTDCNGSGRLVL